MLIWWPSFLIILYFHCRDSRIAETTVEIREHDRKVSFSQVLPVEELWKPTRKVMDVDILNSFQFIYLRILVHIQLGIGGLLPYSRHTMNNQKLPSLFQSEEFIPPTRPTKDTPAFTAVNAAQRWKRTVERTTTTRIPEDGSNRNENIARGGGTIIGEENGKGEDAIHL